LKQSIVFLIFKMGFYPPTFRFCATKTPVQCCRDMRL